MSGPVLAGAVQVTDRRVLLPETDETVGAAGVEGGSSSSVMVIVTVAVALAAPSEAMTVTA